MSFTLMTNEQLQAKVSLSYGLDKHNLRIYQKVPLTQQAFTFPFELKKADKNEELMKMLVIDCKFSSCAPKGQIYELAYVLCQYSKTTSSIVSILDCGEMIEQLETDQDLSTIKNAEALQEKLKGKFFDSALLQNRLDQNTIVCVHNANILRPLLEKRFKFLRESNVAFMCSRIMPKWATRKLQLDELVEDAGYFFDNNSIKERALSLVWLLYINPKHLKEMLEKARNSVMLDMYLDERDKSRLYDVSFRIEQSDNYMKHEVYSRFGSRFKYDENAGVFHTTTTVPFDVANYIKDSLGFNIVPRVHPIHIYQAFQFAYPFKD